MKTFEVKKSPEIIIKTGISYICSFDKDIDHGAVKIIYVPDKLCLETQSFKEYIDTFRHVYGTAEDLVSIILDKIIETIDPQSLQVMLNMDLTPRLKVCLSYQKSQ